MRSQQTRYFSHIILWTTFLFITLALVWADHAILDEVTSGQGRVIPSSQVQVIQNLEGGIVAKMQVREGQIVEKNQVLMQIDNTRFQATFNETKNKITALKLRIIRLNAERRNEPMHIPPELEAFNPLLVEAEKALHQARKIELEQMNMSLQFVEKELELTRPLVQRGAASEVEVLKLRRTVNDLKGEINKFKSQALAQLNEARGELSAIMQTQIADRDRLDRTTVRSPVKGIVKQIKVTTIGGVLKPGMDIIEIVPLEDTLLIEAKIKPADIGFIRPKQKAMVKISAYDFAIYGGLVGKVEQISADTITEEKNGKEETFYLIRVRTDKNYLGTEKKPLYIIPGMMATVDILTGHKSVLDYLLKPILKAKNNALRER